MSVEEKNNNFSDNMKTRSNKTKGISYKERYVEIECPECGNNKAYKDEGPTVTSYKCTKHSCKYNWFVHKDKSLNIK